MTLKVKEASAVISDPGKAAFQKRTLKCHYFWFGTLIHDENLEER